VKSLIIRFPVYPQSPQNLQPAINQAADGIIVGFAVRAYGVVTGGGLGRAIQSQTRPLLYDVAELAITGFAEVDSETFATALPGTVRQGKCCERAGASKVPRRVHISGVTSNPNGAWTTHINWNFSGTV
jgi:hypothetical protein